MLGNIVLGSCPSALAPFLYLYALVLEAIWMNMPIVDTYKRGDLMYLYFAKKIFF